MGVALGFFVGWEVGFGVGAGVVGALGFPVGMVLVGLGVFLGLVGLGVCSTGFIVVGNEDGGNVGCIVGVGEDGEWVGMLESVVTKALFWISPCSSASFGVDVITLVCCGCGCCCCSDFIFPL